MSLPVEITFDTVSLEQDGETRTLSADEFFALPLSTRIRHVIERTAVFYSEGQVVERGHALDQMRAGRAKPGDQ